MIVEKEPHSKNSYIDPAQGKVTVHELGGAVSGCLDFTHLETPGECWTG